MTLSQQRFLISMIMVLALLAAFIVSDDVIVARVISWGLIALIGILSFSREMRIRPYEALQVSVFARAWLFVALLIQMALAIQALRGRLDLNGFIMDRPGTLLLILILPLFGAIIVSAVQRFKELA